MKVKLINIIVFFTLSLIFISNECSQPKKISTFSEAAKIAKKKRDAAAAKRKAKIQEAIKLRNEKIAASTAARKAKRLAQRLMTQPAAAAAAAAAPQSSQVNGVPDHFTNYLLLNLGSGKEGYTDQQIQDIYTSHMNHGSEK